MDIEDLKELGRDKVLCPYYLAKHASEQSDIIILSYNYLVYPMYRGAIQNHIKNSFIVFDEAHNLIKVLEETGTWDFDAVEVSRFVEEIRKRILPQIEAKKKSQGTKSEAYVQAHYFEDFACLLESLILRTKEFINSRPAKSFIDGAQMIDFLGFSEQTKRVMVAIKDLGQEYKVKFIHNFIKHFLYLQTIYEVNPKLLSNFFLNIDDLKSKINFICVDPAICFQFILNFNPSAVILMSGTLSPFEIIEKQLRCSFETKFSVVPCKDKWIERLSVVKLANFYEFSSNKRIELNYKTRNEEQTIRSFFNLLQSILPFVPKGVLIFLASYSLLDTYKTIFDKDIVLKRRFEKSKRVFFENKTQNFLPQFEAYKRCCVAGNGGIFFLVFGGKFSEGIDFKDDLARMVVILGIPFSNPQELKLLAKKDYIEKTEKAYRARAHKSKLDLLAQKKGEADDTNKEADAGRAPDKESELCSLNEQDQKKSEGPPVSKQGSDHAA